MDILIRKRFALPPEPTGDLDTSDAVRTRHLVRAAAEAKRLVSIAGSRGAGKTRAVRGAVRGLGVQLVEPLRLDRERLHLGDIQDAIVSQLSDEKPRRSGEARSGQVRRILARTRGAVLLWIDDAHVLHPSTLRGLKRLLELTWQGEGPLLGIVLTGQQDRTERVPEIGLRSTRMVFEGLSAEEAARALETILDEVLDSDAFAILASSPRARNWLDLEALVDDCLVEAAARGETTVTAAVARHVLGAPASAPAAPADDQAVGDFLRQRAA